MIVRAVINTGGELLARNGPTLGELRSTQYGIDVGKEYDVYAMSLVTGGIDVLVLAPRRPSWMPLGLFDVVDDSLPANWHFAPVTDKQHVFARWGYLSMVRDPNHSQDLTERKLSAKRVFERETGVEITG